MANRNTWMMLAVLAMVAAAGGFWLARALDHSGPELASGTWLPQPKSLAEIHLTDNQGQPFTLHEMQGKPSLVFFGFTRCPDVCPTTLAKLAEVTKAAQVKDLRVLFVTVDPARDTPGAISTYVHAFSPAFVGLTGTQKDIEKTAATFGVAMARVDLPGGDYTMDHSAAVFLLNDRAEIVGIFTPPFDIPRIAEDLRHAAPYLKTNS